MGRFKSTRAVLALALPLVSACQRASDPAASETPDTLGTLTDMELFGTRTSPALVRFVLADPDADPADIELTFSLPNGVEGEATIVPGEFTVPGSSQRGLASPGRIGLDAPSEGRVHYLLWDFAADFGADSLVRDVVVSARAFSHGDPATPLDATPLRVDLGNDAPTALISAEDLAPILSGVTELPLLVRDSSGDAVLVRVEYQVLDGGEACDQFLPAREADSADAPAGEFELATWDGEGDAPAPTLFAWDTEAPSELAAACSLIDQDRAVRLRVTLQEILESPDDEPQRVVVDLTGLRIDNTPIAEEIAGDDNAGDEPDGDPEEDGAEEEEPTGDGDAGDADTGDEPSDEDEGVGSGDAGDDETRGDDGLEGPLEAFLRRIAGAHPWLAPFLSDETFRRVILVAAAVNENSVAVADIDGDGDLDLLWIHAGSSRIVSFLQIAPGAFSSSPLVLAPAATTPEPVALAASDVDRDGDVDVLVARNGGTELALLLQRGAGVFDDKPLVLRAPSALEIARVRITDLDADGDQDIVGWNMRGAPSALFFQTRPGVFEFRAGRTQ